MIILLLRIVMVLFVIWLFAALIKDYKQSGTKLSEVSMGEKAAYAVMGFVLNLLDTLGVGSNATQAAFFKFTKLSPDEELPGNGNVIFGIPVIVEALLFMTVIDVDTLTLFSMLIAAMAGGIVGGKVIAHLPVQKIRTILSITLPCVAIILVCKVNGFGPFGLMGDA
ncbi:MAG: permease, partial [Dorea sp.]